MHKWHGTSIDNDDEEEKRDYIDISDDAMTKRKELERLLV